jgi:hypothetical protein
MGAEAGEDVSENAIKSGGTSVYEVLKVIDFDDDTVEDVDSIGHVEVDPRDEDSVRSSLASIGIHIPQTWSINLDPECGVVAIFDEEDNYVYQLRSN